MYQKDLAALDALELLPQVIHNADKVNPSFAAGVPFVVAGILEMPNWQPQPIPYPRGVRPRNALEWLLEPCRNQL